MIARPRPDNLGLCFLIGLFMTVIISGLYAADPATQTMPVDAEQNWTLGLTRFRSVNLSPENQYLASSLPLQIREKIIGVTAHRWSAEELTAYRKAVINTEMKKEIANLLEQQKKRDDGLFSESKQYLKNKLMEDFNTASAQIRSRLAFLRELDPAKIVITPEKPFVLKDNNGVLFSPPPFSALGYSEEIGVNAVLWGTVEQISGYLYCEFFVFDRVQEKNIFSFKEAGQPQELFSSLERSIPDLLTALWGRPWAALLVDVTPEFSFIKVGGRLLGMGTVEARDLEPGDITIEVDAPGYASTKDTFSLAAGERAVREYSLSKTEESFVLIETVPPEANIYFNSLWMGKTPLVVEKPGITTRLILRREGFHNAFFRLEPGSPDKLLFPLVQGVIDFDAFQKSTRTRFYTSLAAFLLSLPFPVFSYGMAWDSIAGNRSGDTEFFTATYYWTAFISGTLFVNMIFDLLRYLRSRNKPIG
jgi:hypothetical protein